LLERQLGYGIALGSLTRGATPSEYLDRLDLQNLIFHDDIRLERVVANSGKPIIITSQPFIMGVAATAAALDELMLVVKGYEKLTDGAYYSEREGLLVFDLLPRNAILAADGQIYPIDRSSSVLPQTSASSCARSLIPSIWCIEFLWVLFVPKKWKVAGRQARSLQHDSLGIHRGYQGGHARLAPPRRANGSAGSALRFPSSGYLKTNRVRFPSDS
jgi:hypothetical protein